jgi:hypothetical protein
LQFDGLKALVSDGAPVMIFEPVEHGAGAREEIRRGDLVYERVRDFVYAVTKLGAIGGIPRDSVLTYSIDEDAHDMHQR